MVNIYIIFTLTVLTAIFQLITNLSDQKSVQSITTYLTIISGLISEIGFIGYRTDWLVGTGFIILFIVINLNMWQIIQGSDYLNQKYLFSGVPASDLKNRKFIVYSTYAITLLWMCMVTDIALMSTGNSAIWIWISHIIGLVLGEYVMWLMFKIVRKVQIVEYGLWLVLGINSGFKSER